MTNIKGSLSAVSVVPLEGGVQQTRQTLNFTPLAIYVSFRFLFSVIRFLLKNKKCYSNMTTIKSSLSAVSVVPLEGGVRQTRQTLNFTPLAIYVSFRFLLSFRFLVHLLLKH